MSLVGLLYLAKYFICYFMAYIGLYGLVFIVPPCLTSKLLHCRAMFLLYDIHLIATVLYFRAHCTAPFILLFLH